MKATKIKMRRGCENSNDVIEIESIYIDWPNGPRWFNKESIHDYLKNNPGSIKVDIYPYPDIIPAESKYKEKYVKSEPDKYQIDNLLNLPRINNY